MSALTDCRFGRVPGAVRGYRPRLSRRQIVRAAVVVRFALLTAGVVRLGPELGPVEPRPHGAEKVAFLLSAPAAVACKVFGGEKNENSISSFFRSHEATNIR